MLSRVSRTLSHASGAAHAVRVVRQYPRMHGGGRAEGRYGGGLVPVARCAYGALAPTLGRQIVSDQGSVEFEGRSHTE